jgi:hypothetical protein
VRREGHEVLCTLGGTSERADQVADFLEAGLAPDAADPVTGVPVGRSVQSAGVTRDSYDGVEVVRAEVTLTGKEPPGYLFGQISGASVVAWINGTATTYAQ